MKSQGDLEQEQWRSYSFLCSVKRKKETHQETRLWSTGSLTLADKKELMGGWFRCSYKSIKLGTTRRAIQKKSRAPNSAFNCKNKGILTSPNIFLIFFLKRKLLLKNIQTRIFSSYKNRFPKLTTPSTDPTIPDTGFFDSLIDQP